MNIRDFFRQILREDDRFADIDLRDGSAFMSLVVDPLSVLLRPLDEDLAAVVQSQTLANYADMSDVEMDGYAENFLVSRIVGNRATTTVRLYFPQPTPVSIIEGHSFFTASGLAFEATAPYTLTEAAMAERQQDAQGLYITDDIPVQAAAAGAEYLVDVGAITEMSPPAPGLSRVENPARATGGSDRESNEALYNRLQHVISTRQVLNKAGTEFRLREQFPSLEEILLIGFGDEEMGRDRIFLSKEADTSTPLVSYEGKIRRRGNSAVAYELRSSEDKPAPTGENRPRWQEISQEGYGNIARRNDALTHRVDTSLLFEDNFDRYEIGFAPAKTTLKMATDGTPTLSVVDASRFEPNDRIHIGGYEQALTQDSDGSATLSVASVDGLADGDEVIITSRGSIVKNIEDTDGGAVLRLVDGESTAGLEVDDIIRIADTARSFNIENTSAGNTVTLAENQSADGLVSGDTITIVDDDDTDGITRTIESIDGRIITLGGDVITDAFDNDPKIILSGTGHERRRVANITADTITLDRAPSRNYTRAQNARITKLNNLTKMVSERIGNNRFRLDSDETLTGIGIDTTLTLVDTEGIEKDLMPHRADGDRLTLASGEDAIGIIAGDTLAISDADAHISKNIQDTDNTNTVRLAAGATTADIRQGYEAIIVDDDFDADNAFAIDIQDTDGTAELNIATGDSTETIRHVTGTKVRVASADDVTRTIVDTAGGQTVTLVAGQSAAGLEVGDAITIDDDDLPATTRTVADVTGQTITVSGGTVPAGYTRGNGAHIRYNATTRKIENTAAGRRLTLVTGESATGFQAGDKIAIVDNNTAAITRTVDEIVPSDATITVTAASGGAIPSGYDTNAHIRYNATTRKIENTVAGRRLTLVAGQPRTGFQAGDKIAIVDDDTAAITRTVLSVSTPPREQHVVTFSGGRIPNLLDPSLLTGDDEATTIARNRIMRNRGYTRGNNARIIYDAVIREIFSLAASDRNTLTHDGNTLRLRDGESMTGFALRDTIRIFDERFAVTGDRQITGINTATREITFSGPPANTGMTNVVGSGRKRGMVLNLSRGETRLITDAMPGDNEVTLVVGQDIDGLDVNDKIVIIDDDDGYPTGQTDSSITPPIVRTAATVTPPEEVYQNIDFVTTEAVLDTSYTRARDARIINLSSGITRNIEDTTGGSTLTLAASAAAITNLGRGDEIVIDDANSPAITRKIDRIDSRRQNIDFVATEAALLGANYTRSEGARIINLSSGTMRNIEDTAGTTAVTLSADAGAVVDMGTTEFDIEDVSSGTTVTLVVGQSTASLDTGDQIWIDDDNSPALIRKITAIDPRTREITVDSAITGSYTRTQNAKIILYDEIIIDSDDSATSAITRRFASTAGQAIRVSGSVALARYTRGNNAQISFNNLEREIASVDSATITLTKGVPNGFLRTGEAHVDIHALPFEVAAIDAGNRTVTMAAEVPVGFSRSDNAKIFHNVVHRGTVKSVPAAQTIVMTAPVPGIFDDNAKLFLDTIQRTVEDTDESTRTITLADNMPIGFFADGERICYVPSVVARKVQATSSDDEGRSTITLSANVPVGFSVDRGAKVLSALPPLVRTIVRTGTGQIICSEGIASDTYKAKHFVARVPRPQILGNGWIESTAGQFLGIESDSFAITLEDGMAVLGGPPIVQDGDRLEDKIKAIFKSALTDYGYQPSTATTIHQAVETLDLSALNDAFTTERTGGTISPIMQRELSQHNGIRITGTFRTDDSDRRLIEDTTGTNTVTLVEGQSLAGLTEGNEITIVDDTATASITRKITAINSETRTITFDGPSILSNYYRSHDARITQDSSYSYILVLKGNSGEASVADGFGFAWRVGETDNIAIVDNSANTNENHILARNNYAIVADTTYRFEMLLNAPDENDENDENNYPASAIQVRIWPDDNPVPPTNLAIKYGAYTPMNARGNNAATHTHFGISVDNCDGSQWYYDDLRIDNIAEEYAHMLFELPITERTPVNFRVRCRGQWGTKHGVEVFAQRGDGDGDWGDPIEGMSHSLQDFEARDALKYDPEATDDHLYLLARTKHKSTAKDPAILEVDYAAAYVDQSGGTHVGGKVDIYAKTAERPIVVEKVVTNSGRMLRLTTENGFQLPIQSVDAVIEGGRALEEGREYTYFVGDEDANISMRENNAILFNVAHPGDVTIQYTHVPLLSEMQRFIDSDNERIPNSDALIRGFHPVYVDMTVFIDGSPITFLAMTQRLQQQIYTLGTTLDISRDIIQFLEDQGVRDVRTPIVVTTQEQAANGSLEAAQTTSDVRTISRTARFMPRNVFVAQYVEG